MKVRLISYATGANSHGRILTVLKPNDDGVGVRLSHAVAPGIQQTIDDIERQYPVAEDALRAMPAAFSGSYLRAEFVE